MIEIGLAEIGLTKLGLTEIGLTEIGLIDGIILLAAFTQSLTGFGFALVAMALLPGVTGLAIAAPIVALVSLVSNASLWLYYRQGFDWEAITPLLIASLLAIPVGLGLVQQLPEAIAFRGLGLLLLSYTLYEWGQWPLPSLRSPLWAYGFGLMSGLLTGAYNTGGPAVVIYANCRRWPMATFKSNLPGFFWINSLLTITAHGVRGHLTPSVWHITLLTMPAFALGLVMGLLAAKYMNAATFRRVVLLLLGFTGIRLLLG